MEEVGKVAMSEGWIVNVVIQIHAQILASSEMNQSVFCDKVGL